MKDKESNTTKKNYLIIFFNNENYYYYSLFKTDTHRNSKLVTKNNFLFRN
jgi:thioredoxin-related protein